MLVIAIGVTIGAILLLIAVVVLISMAVCFIVKKSKKRCYQVTTNVAYARRSTEDMAQLDDQCDLVTSTNNAYNVSQDQGRGGHDNVTYQHFQDQDNTTQMRQSSGRVSDTNASFKSRIVIKLSFTTNSQRSRQNREYDYVK